MSEFGRLARESSEIADSLDEMAEAYADLLPLAVDHLRWQSFYQKCMTVALAGHSEISDGIDFELLAVLKDTAMTGVDLNRMYVDMIGPKGCDDEDD